MPTLCGISHLSPLSTVRINGHTLCLIQWLVRIICALRLKNTTIAKSNKMFLLVGSHMLREPIGPRFAVTNRGVSVVVGVNTQPKDGEPSGMINWEESKYFLQQISKLT
ncbi:trans-sialidase [Trypanosoma cruzi]|nr:trans-sialidase [Trypanosoma cruzi]